jgi:hypothetical protein
MKHKAKILGAMAVAALFLLAACGGAADATPTIDPGVVYTQAVETAFSQLTQTAQAMPLPLMETPTLQASPTLQAGSPQPGVTNTPLITSTPNGTAAGTPGLTTPLGPRGTATQQSCDNFLLLADITIPDGSIMNPGENFDKVWQIQNLGPCTWNTGYHLVWAYGEWYGTEPVALYYEVPPGDGIQIWVNLTAPTAPGNYFAAFVLQNDRGVNFGIFSPLTIFITVEATPTP